ncbi:hypothetical protein [Halorubrum sp. CSM-61]|uniref:hypothetical protein n=1 Tax=Halorubrum sp. CSM-61 TaxID=2485838 RepID=UPI000F4B0174|nr:hypothetical protein [Halorubrum sp. CSM-61]
MASPGSQSVSSSSETGSNLFDERRVTRRDAVAKAGKALTGGMGILAVSGSATASHGDTKPDHVTISEDIGWLSYYSPMLDLRHVPIENHPQLLGWRFSSPEYETEVGVYMAEYAVQDDVLTLTSHAGDHEFVYVFVDRETGEVDHVAYTAYHWLQGYVTNPNVNTEDGGAHPTLMVAPTYHNYVPQSSATSSSILLDVDSLGDPGERTGPLYQWLSNGGESSLATGAVHEPWNLSRHGTMTDWWSREGISAVNYWIVQAWATIGIRGADFADRGDRDL